MTGAATKDSFRLADVRRLVADQFAHRPAVYWLDFALTTLVAWGTFLLALRVEPIALRCVLLVATAFAVLRDILFIHEISHFRRGVVPGFALIWNLLCGIPLGVPSFMYWTHTDHHKRNLYGTIRDPEYLPLAWLGRGKIVLFCLETLLAPVALVLRFGVLGPLSWLLPPLRRWLVRHASALAINPAYARPEPRDRDRAAWIASELAASAWMVLVAVLVATGRWPLDVVWQWAFVAALAGTINQIRTLAAHDYENDGAPVSVEQQLLDSINVRGVPLLTELVFPVGLKYHALHHLLPDMPYHGLARAHARLLAELPPDSVYRRTERPGLLAVLVDLWRRAWPPRGTPPRWRATSEE